MTKLLRTLATLFAFALLVAACSSDDGEDTTTEDSSSETTADDAEASTTEADDGSADDDGADGGADDGADDGAADDSADDSADDNAADDGASDDAADSSADDDGADDGADDGSADGADDDAAAGDADDAAVAPDAGITILGVSFDSGTVTVRNDGDTAVDFTGYYTCNRPAYAEMPAETLEPGATLDIDVTDLDIRASAGEFGLYSSRAFDSAADMVAYVQWGKADNGRAGTAVEAGLIADGEFIDNGGENIVLE